MSRRKKSKGKSPYLDDEYAALQDHLETLDDDRDYRKKSKGKDMLKLPSSITNGQKPYQHQSHGYSGGGHTTYVHEQHTHAGDKVVWESADGTKKLYAGNGRGVNEASGKWDLIIDLALNIQEPSPGFVRGFSADRFDALRKYTPRQRPVNSELLSLQWNDMGAPPCTLDFWLTLWDMLPEKTLAMCVGGHGRTGTCLASLMIASTEVTYYEAVKTVREKHCDRAIETVAQETYLHKLYTDLLKSHIAYWETDGKNEKDAATHLQNLQDELKYALDHVPSNFSSYGEKPPAKKAEVQAPTGGTKRPILTAFKPTPDETKYVGAERFKIVGEVIYKLSCRSNNCTRGDACEDGAHLGWSVYDIEEMAH